jgi:uncharacterized metal-binding protein YceD (DUF177 family)
VEPYRVNIVGLSNSIHHFRYQIDDGFFGRYGTDLIAKGSFTSEVDLDKRETFLEVNFDIHGTATLICDRSLEPFEHPIEVRRKVIFKFGDEDEELTDEMVVIRRDASQLELGQYMYEFISLEVPMKKLHPRFRDDDEPGEGKIVYSSAPDPEEKQTTDPRWDKLKNLNK